MAKKTLIIILILTAVAALGVFVWQYQNSRAKAVNQFTKISAEELKLMIENDPSIEPQTIAAVKENPEERQKILKNLRETLSLAAEARKQGYADGEVYKENLGYLKNSLLARIYLVKKMREQPGFHVPKEEIETFINRPGQEELFNKYIDNQLAIELHGDKDLGREQGRKKPEGENLKEIRDNWTRTNILAERAKTDAEFMQKSEIELRYKILEAQVLATDYIRKKLTPKIKATNEEIAAYLMAHPEYDLDKKRAKAEAALQRVKAGEDFAKLAAELSEDRVSKDKGGLHENVGMGEYTSEIDQAVSNLKKGQVADTIVESALGYHILQLVERKTQKAADGSEVVRYSFRHILFQKKFEEPGPVKPGVPPPFMTREEIAQTEVEKQKREKLIAEIARQNEISLPTDFTVEVPTTATAKSAALLNQ